MTIFLNGEKIESFNFAGGECHIRIEPNKISSNTKVKAYLYCSDDIMNLLLTIDAIKRINIETNIQLIIPYFPYARQDRVCNIGESLSIKVMADLINSLHCNKLTIYDPHSDVAPALLNNCEIISLANIIFNNKIIKEHILYNNLILVSPDAGAEKKVRQAAKILSNSSKKLDIIYASKERDTETGDIVSTCINAKVQGKDLIILDDICDAGKTFIEIAKILKTQGAKEIYLYITHGIFSRGLEELKFYFKHIYCYHTMLNGNEIDNEFLTILEDNN